MRNTDSTVLDIDVIAGRIPTVSKNDDDILQVDQFGLGIGLEQM